ncbi:hypothetical protein AGOR_G00081290 [Albula goreensis]|uniref:Secreted protein n=1 Tax=Albula goreensis TaxID=1534307 RepID=A0A8T3DL53_9TELE|nr:hypothetical protein AGOR_G00081290 [Albula goreensis]
MSALSLCCPTLILLGALWNNWVALGDNDTNNHGNTHQISGGPMHCGEYSNQATADGQCRIVATLPQLDEQRCPDMFRCTDEVSYWLHENEERKQQILALKETISELQEELRNHRHRIKVLELQVSVGKPSSTCCTGETTA